MKQSTFRIAGWILVGAAFLVPLGYFALRINNQPFLDNALGNWLATIVSVAAGVPIGLEVNRRLHQAELAAQAARDAAEAATTRLTLLSQLEDELLENRDQVGNLQLAMKQSPTSHADLWEWAERIAHSFSYSVFQQLVDSRVATVSELRDITRAHAELRRLQNYVLQAKAAHTFYHAYSPLKHGVADEMLEKVYWKTANALRLIEQAERTRVQLLSGGAG